MRSELRRGRRTSKALILMVVLVLFATAMGTAFAQDAPVNRTGNMQASGGVVEVNPPHEFVGGSSATSGTLTPQSADYSSRCVQKLGHTCYTPSQVRSAYEIPRSYTGAGQSIVIVDAYGSPTIGRDLRAFDHAFGLPYPNIRTYYPQGKPSKNNSSWALETSLDVQWAHAIAPKAAIKLVVARNNSFTALNGAESYAVDHNLGKVMSLSFGGAEATYQNSATNRRALNQSHAILARAAKKQVSVFASTGDLGATFHNSYRQPQANYPSSDPYVTAVGGTNLFLTSNGSYQGGYVWNDANPKTCPYGCGSLYGATGGAVSHVFARPSYQKGVGTNYSAKRLVSDVSYDASVYTGVLVYASFPGASPNLGGFYVLGGTSAGAPQWAGIAALADQKAGKLLGLLNPQLYKIAGNRSAYRATFHDPTFGNNNFTRPPGYSVHAGYDIPTGIGTPRVSRLVSRLAAGG